SGDLARDADDDPGTDDLARTDLLDEVAQHALGNLRIRDHTVLERAHRLDMVGRATEHLLSPVTCGDESLGASVDGDDGRLVQDDATAALIDDGVGGAEVDGEVAHPVSRPPASHAV